MTIRDISKNTTKKRNDLILKMLLKHSVKFVAMQYNLSPMAIYQIAFRRKKELEARK